MSEISNPSLPFFFGHQLISLSVSLASLLHLPKPQSTYPPSNWQKPLPKISHIPLTTEYWYSSNHWTLLVSPWETPCWSMFPCLHPCSFFPPGHIYTRFLWVSSEVRPLLAKLPQTPRSQCTPPFLGYPAPGCDFSWIKIHHLFSTCAFFPWLMFLKAGTRTSWFSDL